MNKFILKTQSFMTKSFLWTSPLALVVLVSTNFPNLEKEIWTTNILAPFLALSFTAWFISLVFVLTATFVSLRYKEDVINDVVLARVRDEREALVSGQAAQKSILVTLAVCMILLILTTGRYNVNDQSEGVSLTIGHFSLVDSSKVTTRMDDGSVASFYQMPMSKTSLVLLIVLIQLTSYYLVNFSTRKKLEI